MNCFWSRGVIPIALVFSFRMLGLFLIIPIFTVAAQNLEGSTPKLMGVALGCYGLAQGLLQIPFGVLSDKWGRKPMILMGLLLFALGSLLGALTHSIWGIIAARILQGMGAVGSVLMALLADVTPEAMRARAMAVLGASIGLSFGIAMIGSPFIFRISGLSGLFYVAFGLSLMAILLVYGVIQKPVSQRQETLSWSAFKAVFWDHRLFRLNISIFCQHLLLTANFFVLPLILRENISEGVSYTLTAFYFWTIGGAFLVMLPLVMLAEKKQWVLKTLPYVILLIAFAEGGVSLFYNNSFLLYLLYFIYFVIFNYLEAVLPALTSRVAPLSIRGTAMGVYSSSQFLGIFVGGVIAGFLFPMIGISGILSVLSGIALLWAFIKIE